MASATQLTPNRPPPLGSKNRKVGSSPAKMSYFLTALITVLLPMAGTVYAGFLFWRQGISLLDIFLLTGMYIWTILGIELGYHRYLTHRSMKTTNWLRAFWAISGSMAGHGPPIWWAAIHRRHHGHSDHEHDPHSPSANVHGESLWKRVKGAWHSHIGWMFLPRCTAANSAHYARDLLGDRTIQRIDRWYALWMVLGLALPAAIGGLATGAWTGAWTGFIWGGLVRLCLGQHALWWGIVTICHLFGSRPFRSHDDSRNNWLVALIFMGDGWHNNHHAFPASAKVGLRWWEFDPTWWVIKLGERLGLFWDIKVPTDDAIEAKKVKS